MLTDGMEVAFLDMREIVPFGTGHPLLATHLSLGHLECKISQYIGATPCGCPYHNIYG
jgi:hypothetical protein